MSKPYSKLTESTKSRLSSVLQRLHKSGISVKSASTMTDLQLRKAIGFKGKKTSFEALKRNISQLQISQNRQEKISNRSLTSYAKAGYRGKGLSRVNSQLRKTVGLNIFYDIAKKVQTSFKVSPTQSYRQTNAILKRARINYRGLSKREKEILSFFS